MRWTPPLIAFALCAALAFGMLGGCGIDSDTICHPVNNPCAGALVCFGGACVERCDVNPLVCPDHTGCDRSTGMCAAFCSFGFCQPPAVCSGGLCVKP
jgi:hypothetical protein